MLDEGCERDFLIVDKALVEPMSSFDFFFLEVEDPCKVCRWDDLRENQHPGIRRVAKFPKWTKVGLAAFEMLGATSNAMLTATSNYFLIQCKGDSWQMCGGAYSTTS